ncbi:protein-disulfide reductase DsbD domain-containing protein [Pseudomonas guariconensis]|uniref:protein-disulfide reductase DsbD domain-containing protein n=1 Tax=Pseudomonas guariconensis TaxID=1288410 RepID=UPI003905A7A9
MNIPRLALLVFSVFCQLGPAIAAPPPPLPQSVAVPEQPAKFLPVLQAFKITTTEQPGSVVVRLEPSPGYYLYKTKLSFQAIPPALLDSTPLLPAGEQKMDPFFGEVLIYRRAVEVILPIKRSSSGHGQLRIGFQGCAEKGLCYPPTVKVMGLGPSAGTSYVPEGANARLASILSSGMAMASAPGNLWVVVMLALILTAFRTRGLTWLVVAIFFGAFAISFSVIAVAVSMPSLGARFLTVLNSPWATAISIGLVALLSTKERYGWFCTRRGRSVPNQPGVCWSAAAAASLGFLSSLIMTSQLTPAYVDAVMSLQGNHDIPGEGLRISGMAITVAGLICLSSAGLTWLARRHAALASLLPLSVAGVLILALERILPGSLGLGLWGFFALAVAISCRFGSAHPALRWVLRPPLVLFGLVAWIGMLSGEEDLFWLARTEAKGGNLVISATASSQSELESLLFEARTAGIPTVVNWSVPWCQSCRSTDQSLVAVLNNLVSQDAVAIVRMRPSSNNKNLNQLLQANGLVLPAGLQVYDQEGREVPASRLHGAHGPLEILAALRQVVRE